MNYVVLVRVDALLLCSQVLEEPPVAPLDCRIHAGFFAMYKTLRRDVVEAVREHLALYPKTCKITVTGAQTCKVFAVILVFFFFFSSMAVLDQATP